MKIGAGGFMALSGEFLEELGREDGLDLLVAQLHRDGIVEHGLALALVARVVVVPGAVVVAAILVGLRQARSGSGCRRSRSGPSRATCSSIAAISASSKRNTLRFAMLQ